MTNTTKKANKTKNEPASTSSPLSIGEGSGVRLSGVRLFDKIIDRTGSDDLKHGVLQERYGDANLLPLWVADMDFETPQFITDALRRRLDHSLSLRLYHAAQRLLATGGRMDCRPPRMERERRVDDLHSRHCKRHWNGYQRLRKT